MQTLLTRSARFHLSWLAVVISSVSCGGGSSPAGPSPQPTPPAASAPAVTAVSPALGATGGGLGITITGSGFVSGATVSIGGVAATAVAFQSATSITATTPANAAGAKDIVVTNPDGQGGRMANAFTYEVPVVAPPSVASIGPTSGPVGGGTNVVIGGSGFAAGATVSFGGAAATGVNVTSATSITANAPAGGAGSVDVVVNNPDGQSGRLSGAFTYVASAPPAPAPPAPVAPTVTGASPASGTTAGGTTVTLTGTGFAAGATVTFDGTAASGVAVTNATTMTAVAPAHAAGAVDVTVTNSNGLSGRLSGGFTYTAPAPAPPAPQPTVVVVTITPNGVTPSDITVSPGTKVRFVNNDVFAHAMSSDPHPDHTQCPPINAAGLLLPGQSRETDPLVTVRLCGYHDHNDADNPKWSGTITVR